MMSFVGPLHRPARPFGVLILGRTFSPRLSPADLKNHLCCKGFYEGFGFDELLLSGAMAWSENVGPPLSLAKSCKSWFSKGSKVETGSCSL